MHTLSRKRILLGVTGGIAAYKSAELTRRLVEAGAEVRVVMSEAAKAFVGPLTFQALSGHPVRSALMDPQAEAAMGHIELARWADAVLIAPCTADFMARLAQGLAGDLLGTLCLATRAPLAIAPAMNTVMWSHPATQDNLRVLQQRGMRVFGPAHGDLACGETGEGRMLEPAALLEALSGVFETGALRGLHTIITAGPTREPLDPVRYLSNRSSGRMGFALARAAAEAGARVTLISGPVDQPTPRGVARVDVESALHMHAEVMQRLDDCDIFIAAAAVADYRPAQAVEQKIKKTEADLALALTRNPDILAEVARHTPRPFVVGFAAETQDLARYARGKLRDKNLDMIAANRVGPNLGFDAPDNALEVFWPGGARSLARTDKESLARQLIALIAERSQHTSSSLVELHDAKN